MDKWAQRLVAITIPTMIIVGVVSGVLYLRPHFIQAQRNEDITACVSRAITTGQNREAAKSWCVSTVDWLRAQERSGWQ